MNLHFHEIGAESRRNDHTRSKRRTNQPVRKRPLLLIRHVGDVRKHHTESDCENSRNADHGEEPERVDCHQRDRQAGEEHRDQQEQFAAAHVRQGADQRRAEERQDALDAHYKAVHQERVLGERGVEHLDDGHGEQAPGKELEEYDDERVVQARISDS